ncbi:MAG: M23 family metallopeptidase [Gorillibacterium sp.]|nr:M23 family metallopeptidase [Gorillibacterium sp.]
MNKVEREKTVAEEKIAGEEIAGAVLGGKYEQLYKQFSQPLMDVVKLDDFRSMGEDFTKNIESFKLTSTVKLNGYESFVWNSPDDSKGLTATVDEGGTLTGIQIMNYSTFPETDQAYSKTLFRMPFQGDWLVFWGGKNILVNYHYEYEPVRYAYDFVIEKDGFSYEGDRTINESYFAFDEDILAPADGVVVAAIDGIADNSLVGAVNEDQPAGNTVTLQHDNGEFSTIAHLKNGSVAVKEGDRVTTGQRIGKCGNSGNSTEPHIHFQVSSRIDEGKAVTIPVNFDKNLTLIRGEIVTGTKVR